MAYYKKPIRSGYSRSKKKGKIGFLVFFILLIAIILLTIKSVITLPYFRIKNIQIKGLKRIPPPEIKREVEIATGASIFELDIDRIFKNIKSKPLVKEVTIRRRLPSTLLIKITERSTFAYVKKKDKLWEVSREGILLKEADKQGDHPVISGVDPLEEKEKLLKILQILKFSRGVNLPEIEKIRVEGGEKGIVAFLQNNLTIIFGDAHYYTYLSYVPDVLQDTARRGEKFNRIDLRFKDQIIVSKQ